MKQKNYKAKFAKNSLYQYKPISLLKNILILSKLTQLKLKLGSANL